MEELIGLETVHLYIFAWCDGRDLKLSVQQNMCKCLKIKLTHRKNFSTFLNSMFHLIAY